MLCVKAYAPVPVCAVLRESGLRCIVTVEAEAIVLLSERRKLRSSLLIVLMTRLSRHRHFPLCPPFSLRFSLNSPSPLP